VFDAQTRLDELSTTIDGTGGTVTINGNQRNAEQALEDVVGAIDSSDGTVTINGRKVPAEEALSTVIGLVNAGVGTIAIAGNNGRAQQSARDAATYANQQYGEIGVGADDRPARTTVNALVREIASRRVDLTVGEGGRPINRGQFYTGGFTGYGGKYEEAGEVHKGEFVFDQDATRENRRLFEAIHAGMDPVRALAATAPPAALTGVGGNTTVTIRHVVTSPDGSVSSMNARQLANILAGDQQAGRILNGAVKQAAQLQDRRTIRATL
jgi:hypothetical protein